MGIRRAATEILKGRNPGPSVHGNGDEWVRVYGACPWTNTTGNPSSRSSNSPVLFQNHYSHHTSHSGVPATSHTRHRHRCKEVRMCCKRCPRCTYPLLLATPRQLHRTWRGSRHARRKLLLYLHICTAARTAGEPLGLSNLGRPPWVPTFLPTATNLAWLIATWAWILQALHLSLRISHGEGPAGYLEDFVSGSVVVVSLVYLFAKGRGIFKRAGITSVA